MTKIWHLYFSCCCCCYY